MKQSPLSAMFYAMIILLVISCGSRKEKDAELDSPVVKDQSVWKEMDDFHLVMAETFHPFKDSANLEPVKMRAAELVVAANKWVGAPLPEKVDNDQVRSSLGKLKAQAANLAESVKTADDNVISDQLTDLHDTFHELQEMWYH